MSASIKKKDVGLLALKNQLAILKKTPVFSKAAAAEVLIEKLIDVIEAQQIQIGVLSNGK